MFGGAGLELTASRLSIGYSTKQSLSLDVPITFKLQKIDFTEEQFKLWTRIHFESIVQKFQDDGAENQIARFKQNSKEMTNFIIKNWSEVQVYTGKSRNPDGSLAFAYKKAKHYESM